MAALRVGFDTAVPDADRMIADAVEVARSSDVAVVFVGTSAENEAEGFDRTDLALPGRQDDLVRAVAAVNPRTVVVVNAGAPVLLPGGTRSRRSSSPGSADRRRGTRSRTSSRVPPNPADACP
ncbi:glycoside hydrolase family 3 C-terminal domain-containing protein [Curtobacterium flaccumfaciens]|nr:glycoside hydrolase family 3 C-terminal domain-containing protein [Curtobacterium flaccumfaciens]